MSIKKFELMNVSIRNGERRQLERWTLEALKTWRKEGREGEHEFHFRIEPLLDAADALIEFEARHPAE